MSTRHWMLTLSSLPPTLVATCALRVVKLSTLIAFASRPLRGTQKSDGGVADRIAAVQRVARYLPGATCLAESLALTWLLRGDGVDARLQIGVTAADTLTAHAWVEADGVALTSARGAAALPHQKTEFGIQETEDRGRAASRRIFRRRV